MEVLCFATIKAPTVCFVFRTLPESPPDSSSEPYSPQQVNGEWCTGFLLFTVKKLHNRI